MSRYVVDASVAAKWYLPEASAELAARLLDGAHDLLAPDLLFAEVGNAIRKRILRAELTLAEGREILGALQAAPLDVHPTSLLLDPTLQIATRAGCTFYDGAYLALALLQRCRMITADRRLHRAIRASPFAPQALWFEDDL